MFRNIYVLQDRVSRQFGELFTGSTDEAVRRDLCTHFALMLKDGFPAADIVCLRVGQLTFDNDNYIIESFVPAVQVCSGSDELVLRQLALLKSDMEVLPDE